MTNQGAKHENYEILNLIGYGLSKFNNSFIKEFGFSTKTAFYNYCIENNIAETTGTIKNRQDLFDPFFPQSGRKGWHQKGNTYIHRKILIDSLFGHEDVKGYVNIVKLYLKESYDVKDLIVNVKPIVKSRFKQLQATGLEAELYFINNFNSIEKFNNGILDDARLYGDGYDFQISVNENLFLAEIKGIRENKGRFRMTEKEYNKALEYGNDYIITIVLNMNDTPNFITIENPTKNLKFKKDERTPKPIIEYYLANDIC